MAVAFAAAAGGLAALREAMDMAGEAVRVAGEAMSMVVERFGPGAYWLEGERIRAEAQARYRADRAGATMPGGDAVVWTMMGVNVRQHFDHTRYAYVLYTETAWEARGHGTVPEEFRGGTLTTTDGRTLNVTGFEVGYQRGGEDRILPVVAAVWRANVVERSYHVIADGPYRLVATDVHFEPPAPALRGEPAPRPPVEGWVTVDFTDGGILEYVDGVGTLRPRHTAEARTRAKALLLRLLTPAQRRQYEAGEGFEVVARSGDTYLLGRYVFRDLANVHVINPANPGVSLRARVNAEFCLTNYEGYAIEDIIVAQKLLLETDEQRFLTTANLLYCRNGFLPAHRRDGFPPAAHHRMQRVPEFVRGVVRTVADW